MWGDGHRQKCGECGQDVSGRDDQIRFLEIRGPRGITSSNVDQWNYASGPESNLRMIDNQGRFLFCEDKNPNEDMPDGQRRALQALSHHHDVWLVRGTPQDLTIEGWLDGVLVPHPSFPSGTWDDVQKAVDNWFKPKRNT